MVGTSNKSVPEMTIEMVSRLEKDLQMVCVFTQLSLEITRCRSPEKSMWKKPYVCSNVAGRNPWKKHGVSPIPVE